MKSDLLKLPELEGVEEILSQDEFIKCLEKFITYRYSSMQTDLYTGARTNAASIWGVSKAMVSQVMNKKRNPTESILNDIGYDEHTVIFYTKRK